MFGVLTGVILTSVEFTTFPANEKNAGPLPDVPFVVI